MSKLNLVLMTILIVICLYTPIHAQNSPDTFKLSGHFGEAIATFDWSPDGTLIVTGSLGAGWEIGDHVNQNEPVVQIWSIAFYNDQLVAAVTDTIDNFEKSIRLVKWSPDGNKIAILEDEADMLRIWDVNNKVFTSDIPFLSYQMHWSNDSESLIFATQQIYFVNASTGQTEYSLSLPPGEQPTTNNPWWITDAQISPNGRLLAAITPLRNENYKFVLWNLQEGGEPLIIDNVGYDMAWSPNSQYLATYTGIFDVSTGNKVVDSSTFTFGFLHPSWSFDGSYLATSDFIFDVMASEPVELVTGLSRLAARKTAWSSQDNIVACLKSDGTIDLWTIVSANVPPEANVGWW